LEAGGGENSVVKDKGVLTMPKVKVNDIQMFYEVHGEGFPLIMIMGFTGNTSWWDPRWIQTLSKKFKIVAFDNRGAGRTDISDREYSIKLFANDTAGLMDALGIPRADVLGISMGGMIAQELVLNYPEKVKKVVLCSTHCGGAKSVQASEEVLGTLTADKRGMSAEEVARMTIPLLFTEDFLKNIPGLEELVIEQISKNPISNEAFMRQVSAIMQFDTCNRLSQVKTPTLILHGKQDILIPPENGSILEKAIPGSRLVYFENCAHGLMEETEEVLDTILEFLAES
jgi:pimeloyl-ACP methyl ester carboxylesterase